MDKRGEIINRTCFYRGKNFGSTVKVTLQQNIFTIRTYFLIECKTYQWNMYINRKFVYR